MTEAPDDKCIHLFFRISERWRKKRYQCWYCKFETVAYSSADRAAGRPMHAHMSVAVVGLNASNKRPQAPMSGRKLRRWRESLSNRTL